MTREEEAAALAAHLKNSKESWRNHRSTRGGGGQSSGAGYGRGRMGEPGTRTRGGGMFSSSGRHIPAGYICRRCKIPGHHIRDCPTNDDDSADAAKPIKVAHGVPRTGPFVKPSSTCARLWLFGCLRHFECNFLYFVVPMHRPFPVACTLFFATVDLFVCLAGWLVVRATRVAAARSPTGLGIVSVVCFQQ